jgi:preprotein translocase subunit SecE
MKTLNKICWILSMLLSLASLVLFFTSFASIVTAGKTATPVGAQLAFGSKITVDGTEYDLAKSACILFCFFLTLIGSIISIFSFKSKGLRYAAPAFGAVSGIYMLVIALSSAGKYVDSRPLPNVTSVEYTPFVLITAITLLAFTLFSAAYLLIDDKLEVMASKGAKLTIPKRIVRFFRDYKSEINKIIWPGFKEVVKNTVIVLIICLLIGAFVWLVDLGLGKLLDVILK